MGSWGKRLVNGVRGWSPLKLSHDSHFQADNVSKTLPKIFTLLIFFPLSSPFYFFSFFYSFSGGWRMSPCTSYDNQGQCHREGEGCPPALPMTTRSCVIGRGKEVPYLLYDTARECHNQTCGETQVYKVCGKTVNKKLLWHLRLGMHELCAVVVIIRVNCCSTTTTMPCRFMKRSCL